MDETVSHSGFDSGVRIIGMMLLLSQMTSLFFVLLAEFNEYDFWSACYEFDDSQSIAKGISTAREFEYYLDEEGASNEVMIPTSKIINEKEAFVHELRELMKQTMDQCEGALSKDVIPENTLEKKNSTTEAVVKLDKKQSKSNARSSPKRKKKKADAKILEKEKKIKSAQKAAKISELKAVPKPKEQEKTPKVRAPPANFQELAVQAMIDEMLASLGSDLSTQEKSSKKKNQNSQMKKVEKKT